MSSTIEVFPADPNNQSLPVRNAINAQTGPRLTNVGVSLIFWGSAWAAVPPPTPSPQQFTNAIKSLLNSNYLESLSQYGVTGAPSLISVNIASQSDPPSQPSPPAGLTPEQLAAFQNQQVATFDQQLQALVTSCIDAGAVPAPDAANTRLYAVILPRGFRLPNLTGEHQAFRYNGVAATTAWLINDGSLNDKFSAMQGFSHELAEACSDPDGSTGVRLTGNDNVNWEIGDVCRWGIDYSNGYAIQSYYSDTDKACVLPLTRAVTAPGAKVAVVSRAPDSLSIAIVSGDGITYSGAWEQDKPDNPPASPLNAPNSNRKGLWRGWWSINGGQTESSASIGLVARSPYQLDAFVTGADGHIYTAAWDSSLDIFDGAWRGWWPILTGQAPAGAPVSAVSRDPNKLDAFVVAGDGHVWTAAWDQNVTNGAWRGWWQVLNLVAIAGGNVTAVSRGTRKLDIFAVGSDGVVYTAAWDQDVAQGAWRGWWPVAGGRAIPGARVHVVSRDPNKLDLFVIGTDGGVYTAAWDQNVTNGMWRGWWRIGELVSQLGGFVTAVSRDPNKLDVFAVGTDGGVATAAWDQNVAESVWRGWWPIAGGQGAPGSMVSAASRDLNKLDVFVIGNDGGVWTAAWDQNVANGAWRGWWPVPN
jgi:hypothetical protein